MPLACDEDGSRDELLRCDFIACYDCLYVGTPADIRHWADGGQTALCPQCGLDFVLGFNESVDRDVLIEANMVKFPWRWKDDK